MSYQQQPQRHNPLRPYAAQDPGSYESLTPPFTNSTTGGTNTPISSIGGSTSEGSSVMHQQRAIHGEKHQALYMGGTGHAKMKENPAIVRKRICMMIFCGLIIAAIITIAILGVKKML